jgi:hypothetical protein
MRKVWTEVGAGLGALAVLAVVAFGGVVVRAKGRAQERLTAAMQEVRTQKAALAELNTRFDFPAPGEGQLVVLDEKRMDDYLAVRRKALAALEELQEEEVKSRSSRREGEGRAVEARRQQAERTARLQAAIAEGLREHRMSPREFSAITGQLMHGPGAGDEGTREALRAVQEGARKLAHAERKLAKQLEDDELPEEAREMIAAQRESLEEQRERLEEQAEELRERMEEEREAAREQAQAQAEARRELEEARREAAQELAEARSEAQRAGAQARLEAAQARAEAARARIEARAQAAEARAQAAAARAQARVAGAAETGAARGVAEANAKVLARLRERLQKDVNTSFDALVAEGDWADVDWGAIDWSAGAPPPPTPPRPPAPPAPPAPPSGP